MLIQFNLPWLTFIYTRREESKNLNIIFSSFSLSHFIHTYTHTTRPEIPFLRDTEKIETIYAEFSFLGDDDYTTMMRSMWMKILLLPSSIRIMIVNIENKI